MTVRRITTANAPQAIGPYSQGVIANGLLFTAGQIGIDPQTGRLVDGGFAEQTERVLTNLSAVLEAAGASWGDVVKTTVYLHDMADFPTFNEMYGRHIGDARPARSTVQAAGLPRGALVEIDAVVRVSL
ncbi:MAG TPA: RidA family protein [Gemmatimonadaceae bacterium]|nr:RidA family protein [Gemmatimonadaceae bacterium]